MKICQLTFVNFCLKILDEGRKVFFAVVSENSILLKVKKFSRESFSFYDLEKRKVLIE